MEEVSRLPVLGRTADAKLANAIEWASKFSAILPWTLTSVVRLAELLSEDQDRLLGVLERMRPFVRYLQRWMPSDLICDLLDLGVLDRDSATLLLRELPREIDSLDELARWLIDNYGIAAGLLGQPRADLLAEVLSPGTEFLDDG